MNATLPDILSDYWGIAVKRKWLIIPIILVAVGISALLCIVMPKSYRSSTLILVENQKIPERYVQGVVSGTVQERLNVIQQQVMSRTLLSKVVTEFNLYPEKQMQESPDAAIATMRKDIKIETKGRDPRNVEAFIVSFSHSDPMVAMKVTTRLASEFIEENLKIREQFVEGALQFLDHELLSAQKALEDKEGVISAFKSKHMGELPGQLEANLRALDRLQNEVPSIHESLSSLSERLSLLGKAIRDYEENGTTTNLPASLSAPVGRGKVDPLLTRLKELERSLATLSSEYKDTYPDVIQTKQEIEQLKAQLAARSGKSEHEEISEVGKATTGTKTPFDAYLEELKKQRNEVLTEQSALKARLNRITAQMKEYEDRVERTPTREQELMILLRDYDNMQKSYQSLHDKKINARIAENLEKRQKGEQFRVVDPPNLPTKPDKPDRLLIMGIGLLLGCGIGYGSAFALEQMSLPFRRPEEVENLLGLPVFATIPDFQMAYATGSAQSLPSRFAPRIESSSGSTPRHRALPDKTMKSDAGLGAQLLSWKKDSDGNGKLTSRGTTAEVVRKELNLVTRWKPQSVVAEQFRVAATRMVLMGGTRTSTVVLVTSSVKEEGKSATASNLGYILAQDMNKATLLIDCDFKRPVLHTYTGVASKPGIADVLHRDQPLESSLHRLGESPLWILPAGNRENWTPALSNIHQLDEVLTKLRARFEYIILDAPPILPLADTNLLVPFADLLVMVVRSGRTMQEVVRKALHKIKPTSQTGVILTGHRVDHMPYYLREYYYVKSDSSS